MKEAFIQICTQLYQITAGIIGGFIGLKTWGVIIDTAGAVGLAFLFGVASYLGKLTVDCIRKRIEKKHKKDKK